MGRACEVKVLACEELATRVAKARGLAAAVMDMMRAVLLPNAYSAPTRDDILLA